MLIIERTSGFSFKYLFEQTNQLTWAHKLCMRAAFEQTCLMLSPTVNDPCAMWGGHPASGATATFSGCRTLARTRKLSLPNILLAH